MTGVDLGLTALWTQSMVRLFLPLLGWPFTSIDRTFELCREGTFDCFVTTQILTGFCAPSPYVCFFPLCCSLFFLIFPSFPCFLIPYILNVWIMSWGYFGLFCDDTNLDRLLCPFTVCLFFPLFCSLFFSDFLLSLRVSVYTILWMWSTQWKCFRVHLWMSKFIVLKNFQLSDSVEF